MSELRRGAWRRRGWCVLLGGLFLALAGLGAAAGATPCCKITGVDAKKGVVTAREIATGETVLFPASPTAIKGLKVGQKVELGFIRETTAAAGFWPFPEPGPRCPCGIDSQGKCWCTSGTECLPPDGRWGCHVTVKPDGKPQRLPQ